MPKYFYKKYQPAPLETGWYFNFDCKYIPYNVRKFVFAFFGEPVQDSVWREYKSIAGTVFGVVPAMWHLKKFPLIGVI